MRALLNHRKALIAAALLTLWLRFGLTATAMFFYELYHLTGVEFVYWGYSLFKVAGYYFSVWSLQTLASVAAGALLFLLFSWRGRRAGGLR